MSVDRSLNASGDEQADEAELLEATERWFLERGIPHFIEDYRAREDILTRASPALMVVFFLSTLFVFREEWTGWQQALVVVLTLTGLAAVWAVINLLLGRRPFAPPTRVNRVEVIIIVCAPAAIAFFVGGHGVGAAVLLSVQSILLGLIYLSASYAVLPILKWAGGQVLRQLGDVMRVLTRALPILLLFTMFLFINTEAWQVASSLKPWQFAGVLVLFAGVAVVFVVVWLSDEIDDADGALDSTALRALVAGTPMSDQVGDPAVTFPPLTRKQRANMLLVLVVSQIVQAMLVAVAVFAFFVAFGTLAIGSVVQKSWLGGPDPTALYKVSGLLAMFSALYFAVYAVTDGTYRAQFFAPIRHQLEKAIAVRAAYLRARSGTLGHAVAAATEVATADQAKEGR